MKQAVFEFVRVGALGRGGGSPLHLTRDSSSVGRYPICAFPSMPAISFLLECGADPNSKDVEGNTALHSAHGSPEQAGQASRHTDPAQQAASARGEHQNAKEDE